MRRLAEMAFLLSFVALSAAARADAPPRTLRLATIAPDGTAWARELRAFAREVTTSTDGALQMKIYMGGLVGDDLQAEARIRRDQLDGVVAGGMLCEHFSPTMRAVHLLARDRDEAAWLHGRQKAQIDEEFKRAGYAYLGASGLGPTVLFTREPVRSMSDLKAKPLWVWDLDEVVRVEAETIGMRVVSAPVADAARLYDEGKTDGFLALPSAALAFQWSAQARYVTDLRFAFVTACLLLSHKAFDQLTPDQREKLRSAGAKLEQRTEDLMRQQEDALINGAFARQGLKRLALDEHLRAEFERESPRVLARLAASTRELEHTGQLLGEYRREHPRRAQR